MNATKTILPALFFSLVLSAACDVSAQLLEKVQVTKFEKRWNDAGSRAKIDCTLWHPKAPDGYFTFGSVAFNSNKTDLNQNQPVQSYAFKAVKEIDGKPLIVRPTGYKRIWTDKGSGARQDGSMWLPIAPDGYIALGIVAAPGHSKEPSISDVACILNDPRLITRERKTPQFVWKKRDTDPMIYAQDLELSSHQMFLADPGSKSFLANPWDINPAAFASVPTFTLDQARKHLIGKWKANLEKSEARFGKVNSKLHQMIDHGFAIEFSTDGLKLHVGEASMSAGAPYDVKGPTPDQYFQVVAQDAKGKEHIENVQFLDGNHIVVKLDDGNPPLVFDRQERDPDETKALLVGKWKSNELEIEFSTKTLNVRKDNQVVVTSPYTVKLGANHHLQVMVQIDGSEHSEDLEILSHDRIRLKFDDGTPAMNFERTGSGR